MELFDTLEKYHKIVKEEEKFNYKYNPLLNYGKKKINYQNQIGVGLYYNLLLTE